MGKYIVKRLILLIPTVFLVCVITFILMRIIPGTAVDQIVSQYSLAGINVSREEVEVMLGMDKPATTQFFIWFGDILRGDLGDSLFQSETVGQIIGKKLPITLELSIMILLLSNIISIPLGLLCAARQDGPTDNIIRTIAVILMAVPVFWLATLVLVYPAVWWKYAPPSNYYPFFQKPIQNIQMFLIPAVLGAVTQAGIQIRLVRTMTLENLRQDYIRTAWAKGASESWALTHHALRNAMIPVVTSIGGAVAGLIGGSVVLENMFNIPGIGATMVNALSNRDYPLVQGCVLIFSVVVMVVNLLVDVGYKWIDPRVEIE
ncbi:MAG: ABC transporter permease [Eubacterium sp.]|nr:ABC transporter permease [Eubacterium sp.]